MTVPSILRRPWLARYALRHPRIFALGFSEARTSSGLTFDNDPWSARSTAYDLGRDLRLWGAS
jgi:hypothetical protein